MTGTADGERAPEDVLVALADPIRREVLAVLAREGGATSTSLAAGLPVTRQGVAKHLAVLDRAGLVRAHRAGREVRYEVDPQPLRQAMRWMDTLATQWEHRLDAIKDLAEGTTGEA
ncbi:ArsR/SmtB family transcription factor [Streptomyces diastatochromogenes]|uniref:Transcriptional regulator n=1 Tax=Streptomyces diastatochromogenes TaxID=42236 RepID=A0A233SG09_STRDA|nr:metalloregulator ArsR/SmtB family transcription factor [Streptomyces diastatochromogenes]MCZ0988924.1 metalloregulator ArsR/SmtB family transcription factor [Streptomyces diastatochromogenes]OXY94581.1 transcriptional regulator [Streptomyces diastatochromogenes]